MLQALDLMKDMFKGLDLNGMKVDKRIMDLAMKRVMNPLKKEKVGKDDKLSRVKK